VAPGLGRIAVAHTRDDRVETFFMRAVAGSGAGGLNALAPVRGRIVRPLTDVDRVAVREWLETRGHPWREDASNTDTARARALVRAELIPAAEKLNPAVRANVVRTMELLADDDALLTRMAEAFARDFARVVAGQRVEFERQWMRTLEPTMARRTIRSALLEAFPWASRLESSHIEALAQGVSQDDFARDLPGGLRAECEYGKMVILRTDDEDPRVAPSLLPLPGNADLGPAGTVIAREASPNEIGAGDSVVIDAGTIASELTIDSVREGDRIRPLGMAGRRKLSDMLSEAKVPRRSRPSVPVVRDGDEIVWVAGVQMSDVYKVTEGTTRAFRLTWNRSHEDTVGQDLNGG
jgi:tRNA(Ile)-lysidine synthase